MSTVFGAVNEVSLVLKESDRPFSEQFGGTLSTFGALLAESGAFEQVKPGHTVFAFTDKAYRKLMKQIESGQNRHDLSHEEKRALIHYHLSPDALAYEDLLTPSLDRQVDTMQGSPVGITYENDAVLVRDVRQQVARVLAAVASAPEEGEEAGAPRRHLYLIDSVLVPTAAMLVRSAPRHRSVE